MHARQLEPIGGDEGDFADGRLEERDAEGVEIEPRVERSPLRLLGREVLRRADRHVHAGGGHVAGDGSRDAEVREDGTAVRVQQDVVGLQIAVDHPLGVGELERPSHVARDAYDIGLRKRAFALEPRRERVGAQVHREVDVAPGARHEADADDVRVLELLGGFGFVAEPALELAVAGVARHQDFDGDGGPVQLATREHPGKTALAE